MTLVMAVLAGVALLVGLALVQNWRNTLRYNMVVEVETPQGVVSGAAVREVRYSGTDDVLWRLPIWLGESRPQWRLTGEAVAVDLPNGRVLFVLLKGADGNVDYAGRGIWTTFRVMDRDAGPKGGPHELWPAVPVIREPITYPVPMLVTFGDMQDPKSVTRVDPDNLAASFGPGIRLKRITIEATRGDVTSGIEEKLGWLRAHRGTLKPNPPTYLKDPSDPELSLLGKGSFSTELVR
jgi:hypothetical protein